MARSRSGRHVDDIREVGLADSGRQLLVGEPLRLPVAAGVPGEDAVVVLPAGDGIGPAAAGVGQAVQ